MNTTHIKLIFNLFYRQHFFCFLSGELNNRKCCYINFIKPAISISVKKKSVSLTDAQKQKVAEYMAECVKTSGVKPELIAEMKSGKMPNDEGLKKFILCFFQKTKILDSNGNLNVDVALSKLPPGVDKADAQKLLEECKKKKGATAEDKAFETLKCYHSGTKTHIMF